MISEFHPEAEEELVKALEWYSERSEIAARALAHQLDAAITSIVKAPERKPELEDGFRRHILTRFHYTIVYRVQAETVFVIAVTHQRRKPGYWRDRT